MIKRIKNKLIKWLSTDEVQKTTNEKKLDSLYDCYQDLKTVVAIETTSADFSAVASDLATQYGANFDADELQAVFAEQFKQHLEDKLSGKTKSLKRML